MFDYHQGGIRGWTKVLLINDGRPRSQSDLNDAAICLWLEDYIKTLLVVNRKRVVSQSEVQILNQTQSFIVATQKKGNCGLFMKKNIVTKLIPEETQREVFPDELKRIIERSGRTVQLLQNKVALVDGERSFIHTGSDKQ